jgi:hypothetical protein
VSGYERIAGPLVASSNVSTKTASASCPAGKVAIGGGHNVPSATVLGEIVVVQGNLTTDTTWTVRAVEDNMDNGDVWSLQAFVVCVND